MELTHDFTVPASPEQTWTALMDLERVGGCFPGASVTSVEGDSFSGQVKVKLGLIQLLYTGSGRFVERDDAAHHAVLEAKGKDKRGNGTAGANVTIRLSPGSDHTRVDVTTDLSITGKPAQFGRGVMQDVSDKLLGQFVDCLQSQLGGDQADEPAAGSAVGDMVAGDPADDDATDSDVAAAWPGSPAPAGTAPARVSSARDGAAPPTLTPAGPTTPTSRPSTPSAPGPRPTSTPQNTEPLDLGSTVLPVLIKSYAPHAVGALLAIALGYVLGRRSR